MERENFVKLARKFAIVLHHIRHHVGQVWVLIFQRCKFNHFVGNIHGVNFGTIWHTHVPQSRKNNVPRIVPVNKDINCGHCWELSSKKKFTQSHIQSQERFPHFWASCMKQDMEPIPWRLSAEIDCNCRMNLDRAFLSFVIQNEQLRKLFEIFNFGFYLEEKKLAVVQQAKN